MTVDGDLPSGEAIRLSKRLYNPGTSLSCPSLPISSDAQPDFPLPVLDPKAEPLVSEHDADTIPLENVLSESTLTPVDEGEVERLLPNSALGKSRRRRPRAFLPKLNNWVANPYWLLPIVLVVSMSRGVTVAPRIQVYKAIACQALNTEGNSSLTIPAVDCSSAAVQARASRIHAAVSTLMGILSAVTTGFWSRLGDVHGRKPILVLFLIGAMCMEAFYVLVMQRETIFGRHAENFLLVGPILEGLVGGLSSFSGVVHAYTSDCTKHGSRSKIFSTIQGIVFVGLASGPVFSDFLLPNAAIEKPFALSIGLFTATLAYIVLICPESRQPTAPDDELPNKEASYQKPSLFTSIRTYILKAVSALIVPITMFAPRTIPGRPGRNYNLLLVGVGLSIYLVSTGIYGAKYMYAQHAYTWTSAELGHYMSILWITRAINLLVVLPIVVSYLKPKTKHADADTSELAAEMQFDKRLALASLALDSTANALVALVPSSSQVTFIALSCFSSFASGGNPTLHSLGAVCLHACGLGSEVGAMFGGMAVLSAIAHILESYVYALTYGATVAEFPKAIFVLAAGLLAVVVLLVSRVSTRSEDVVIHPRPTEDDQETV